MATENTETAGTTATASAGIEPLTTTRAVYDAGKEVALAKVAAIRAEKTQAGQQPGENAGGATAEQAGEQSAQGSAQEGQEQAQASDAATTAAETSQETAAAEPSEEDRSAQALLLAARENRALIEQRRRIAQREAELKERESKLGTATVQEREAVARLTTAVQSGDPIAILRAAGIKDEDLSQFALNMIERLPTVGKQEQQEQKQAPTAEEVAALVLKQQQEAQKAERERAEAEQAVQLNRQRDEYFSTLGKEFKTNAKSYPVLSALRPTHGQLESAFVDHFNRTGERLTPPQLLAALEKEYGGRGLTVAPKKPAAAGATVATATSKTVGARATSDAGSVTVRDEGETRKPKDVFELNEEGRRAAVAEVERRRAAKKAARA